MTVSDLVSEYLTEARAMQIATSVNGQPWTCTVYFAHDQDWNLYWISLPSRRHSIEIEANQKVAGAIVLPHTPGEKVRGLQFEGEASLLAGPEEAAAHRVYGPRYNRPTLLEDVRAGRNPHRFYAIRPKMFVLFDELNFPNDPRQEARPKHDGLRQ